jgi:glycosyltransferase involved in cell wall biosynthesis
LKFKDGLRNWRTRLNCLPWWLSAKSGIYQGEGPPVRFVIENADWAIRWVGKHICEEIEALEQGRIAVTSKPENLAHRLVHFGSQYMWLDWGHHMSRSNRFVTSFFHGKPEDGSDVARHIDRFLGSVSRLERIVTAASLVEKRLLDWGVPHSKLVRIPIGVDTSLFSPPNSLQRIAARQRFNIPDDAVVVGSFQKDGLGWGDGMEPKLIKGPDIYIEAMRIISMMGIKVVGFLTGPARGYVKQGLTAAGIPFVHTYVKEHSDLVHCYHALDLYLVTSREEGGPMGLLESMASGVPVVSTQVGMAPDLIINGSTGRLANVDDAQQVAAMALELISMPNLHQLREQALEAVKIADWSVVAQSHWNKVYQPLLSL